MDKPLGRGLSFRNKLIVSFLLVSLLPMLAVQMMSYYISTGAMENKINDLVQVNLLQTSKSLDTSMKAYEDLLFQLFIDDDVMALVKDINDPDTDSQELSRRKLINILSRYSYAKEGIRSVAIITASDTVVAYDQQTGSPYENLWSGEQDATSLPLYQSAMASRGETITPPMKIDTFNNSEQYVFHLARKLADLNNASLEGIGVAVITVYESVLSNAINLADTQQDSARLDNRNFLTDGDNVIVSSPDKSQIGLNVKDVMGKSTIMNTYFNASSRLKINNLIDQKQLFKEMYGMQRLSLYAGLSAMILSCLLIYYFSGTLTRSIRRIVRAMRTAQLGTLDVQVQGSKTNDELSIIASSFNKMMHTVSELMTETKEAGEKRREAEIRALEAQINPHFLYNTLDSINWMAIEKEEHQISQMLKELAQILRYSVKDSNKLVPLREELRWMNSYVILQQHRFRSSFGCEVDCEERLLSFHVHKLLLQPFIENAIIHGFDGVKNGGLLRIAAKATDDQHLTIRIEDNGHGMPEEKVRQLMADAFADTSSSGGGLGIRNVADRVRSYYGNRGRLDIQSRLGEGTIVKIVLPIETNGGETA